MFESFLKPGVISLFESTVYYDCTHTIFRGRIKSDRLSDFYSSCDVGIAPSIFDPCPDSVVEMDACGLPVITTK